MPQSSQENIKKEIPSQMFSCEFYQISSNILFKEPFERLSLDKHSFVHCRITTFRLFKNDVSHIFRLCIFFGLICRVGTRVNSILKTGSQKPIFNLVEHLRWNFFTKIVDSLKRHNGKVGPRILCETQSPGPQDGTLTWDTQVGP